MSEAIETKDLKQLEDTAESKRYRELLYALERDVEARGFRLELAIADPSNLRLIVTASTTFSEETCARIAGKVLADTVNEFIAQGARGEGK